jgi:8-oxo-dGTP pyrophosphatase MutT (NUDIX family)
MKPDFDDGLKTWKLNKVKMGPTLPIFQVQFNFYQNPRNQEIVRSLVLQTRDWVNIIPVTNAGEILFVRQFRFGIAAPTTEIPGGIVDPGENSHQAAMRELLEETGFTSSTWTYLGAVEANPAVQNNLCHHWLAADVKKVAEPDPGPGEDLQVLKLTLPEVRAEIKSGRLRHSLALSALSRAFPIWENLKNYEFKPPQS